LTNFCLITDRYRNRKLFNLLGFCNLGEKEDANIMKILVLNCGSSSIKYKLYDNDKELAEGLIEKIGEKKSKITTYKQGIDLTIKQILGSGKIKGIEEIDAVGHRVVHGGTISKPCLIDKKVINVIEKFSELAPLHNPANLSGIIEMGKILPNAKHVAVFDTAFHQTMPKIACIYALPYKYYEKFGIRRYGFHGTSHKYAAHRAAEILGKKFNDLNLISCHLGAGCSIAAVKNGKVIDTSMGFTPLEGLIMGTRPGDIDPGILVYLQKKLKISLNQLDEILNKKSGLLGISGVEKDFRNVLKCARKGNFRCKLALDMFCYRVKKYIGAYAAALGKVNAIIFTGGIGENNDFVRDCASEITCLDIEIDKKKNRMMNGKEGIISAKNSKIAVLVIPADEERMIAIETQEIVKTLKAT